MSTSSASSPIVRFYDPNLKAPDAQGRTLVTILSWSDSDLENSHDYIQTVFPLPETSPIDPSAPVIDRATFTAFRSRPELRSQLRQALGRICLFYGFDLQENNDGKIGIERLSGGSFMAQASNWVTAFNHNHLRISRIIRCLRVLGLPEDARAFFSAVMEVHDDGGGIGDRSLMYWTRAMERPLYLAPDDEVDEGMGKDFLYEFEAQNNPGAIGGEEEDADESAAKDEAEACTEKSDRQSFTIDTLSRKLDAL